MGKLRRVVIDAAPANSDGRRVELSGHAVAAYQERFKPSLRHSDARENLYSLMGARGKFQTTRPLWLAGYTNEVAAYIVIDDDLALPLRRHRSKPGVLIAPTCLYRA